MIPFHFVSDKVPAEIIRACTSDCYREDCKLSAKIGETTLVAVSDYYDRDGQLIINDKNRLGVEVCCRQCWGGWKVYKINDKIEKQITQSKKGA